MMGSITSPGWNINDYFIEIIRFSEMLWRIFVFTLKPYGFALKSWITEVH